MLFRSVPSHDKGGIGVTNPTEKVEIAGNVMFDNGAIRVIKLAENTPLAGDHLAIVSGYGAVLGTNVAGNIYIFPPLADVPGNVLICTDTLGDWTGGFLGVGVGVPAQMLDVGGKIKVHSVDTLLYDHPVMVWDETDSTLNVITLDSLASWLSLTPALNLWYQDGDSVKTNYHVKLDSSLSVLDTSFLSVISTPKITDVSNNYTEMVNYVVNNGIAGFWIHAVNQAEGVSSVIMVDVDDTIPLVQLSVSDLNVTRSNALTLDTSSFYPLASWVS